MYQAKACSQKASAPRTRTNTITTRTLTCRRPTSLIFESTFVNSIRRAATLAEGCPSVVDHGSYWREPAHPRGGQERLLLGGADIRSDRREARYLTHNRR